MTFVGKDRPAVLRLRIDQERQGMAVIILKRGSLAKEGQNANKIFEFLE